MIGRRYTRKQDEDTVEPRGFDDFELRLGDMMRGERATLGKSLLDVERDLRIRASYIAAIENADPDAFDTPGFIPGYVRSYARYLNMDPDRAYAVFCDESGFTTAHGMSAEASGRRKPEIGLGKPGKSKTSVDPLVAPATPFVPASESFLARIEPGAIGSALVLLALIGGIGYGGWSVLTEVQRVQVAPVENTPDVLSDLDPLQTAVSRDDSDDTGATDQRAGGFAAPEAEDRLDRLYRPEALDVPVMVARDAPISTLNPAQVGLLRPDLPQADRDSIENAVADAQERPSPQVLETAPAGVRMVAVRPAWVRVRAADGTVIYEGIMNAGDTWDVPATEDPPTLRVGESGAIYFNVNGEHYGPAGPRGSVTSDLALDATGLTEGFEVADVTQDQDLSRYVAELQTGAVPQDSPASE
jgi:cytoskeletal protein RodZ